MCDIALNIYMASFKVAMHMSYAGFRLGGCGRGRKQITKAPHTCMSWYADVAMFGSSSEIHCRSTHQTVYHALVRAGRGGDGGRGAAA